MRVVFDSNVLVSAFAGRGLCAELWDVCIGSHKVVTGRRILDEVRKAFVVKMKMPKNKADLFTEYIRDQTERVEPVTLADVTCRDPSDVGIIGIAVAGDVEAIVTGDGDLQILGSYRGISIISPRQLWERISKR